MDRLSHTDFLLRDQPRLFIQVLRAVLRQDPGVVSCTAHAVQDIPNTYRLRINAADPLLCLHNATENIKVALVQSVAIAGNMRSALPNARHH